MKHILRLFLCVFFLVSAQIAYSHSIDQSYIYLRVYETAGIEGRFDVKITDLNETLGLSLPLHPTPEELAPYLDQIEAYFLANTAFSSVYGEHQIVFTGERGEIFVKDGDFLLFHFKLENVERLPDDLTVTYSAFLENDPKQMNLLGMEYNWKAGLINNETIFALDFTEGNSTKTMSLTDTSLWKGFEAMVRQGVWHIWIGLDHILFLVALILPSVVRRREPELAVVSETSKPKFDIWGWDPVPKFKPAFIYIIKVITFFTIAHTITLSLASLNIINLPSRLVETLIAFSIGLAAYHNIKPIFKGKDWVIAFVFGLFHGFGFASVLADLGFKGENLTLSLLGFNIGVELGQVAIIFMIFPVLYLIRKLKLYPKLLVFISIMLIIISLYWFVERAFDIDLPLDDYLRREGYKIAVKLGLR
ncbi:MAG: HupE/UreJ family protein [Bacteroidota bacterium]